MNEKSIGVRGLLAAFLAALLALTAGAAGGPLDVPASTEPRVPVATSLSVAGFLTSKGTHEPFQRMKEKDTVYSRDLLLALPGFQVKVRPRSKAAELTLWGNLPGLSDSPVLESAVILHDTSHLDLDFTLLRGRVVLTNTKKKGPARVWLRAPVTGVMLTLAAPGDRVALEIYGRKPPGARFSVKKAANPAPVNLWDVYVLKGRLDIRAGQNQWAMAAPPGRAHFHGDSVNGPSQGGPEALDRLPAWADPKAEQPATAKLVEATVAAYRDRLKDKSKSPEEVGKELMAAADKDTNKERAAMVRRLIVYALAAMDDVEKVAEMLDTSKHAEVREAAVIALRHWIGVRADRDEKLFHVLVEHLEYRKPEAEAVLQGLHSPFAADQPETYETLIACLNHRRQAVRELAHWHLVRLTRYRHPPAFDASAAPAERAPAVAAWKERIPPGELPKPEKDDTEGKNNKD